MSALGDPWGLPRPGFGGLEICFCFFFNLKMQLFWLKGSGDG